MGVQNPMWSERGFQEALSGNETWYTEILNGERVRVFSRPQRLPNEEMGVIQAIAPLEEIERAVQGVTITLLLLLPVALLFAGVGGAVLTERALHPVRDLTAAARGIQTSNLSARLPVSGGDEFARLSDVLNGMLQRLEDGFHRERRFTADASHELKTPLAIIKANTSLGLEDNTLPPDYHKTLRTIDRATDRANRIVQDLLFLAREGKGSVPLRCERILLQTLFQEAIDSVGGEAQRITLGEIPDSSVQGDRHHLTRLLTNLLGNAVRYTPFPGTITLSGRIEGGFVLFEVRDTGEGIPAEHLPHLMEPFYRVDAARTRDSGGSGLGLAICRSIARSHGGDIQISSAVGHGTTVTVRLPRSSV
jgi:signal transduction histidine kinase